MIGLSSAFVLVQARLPRPREQAVPDADPPPFVPDVTLDLVDAGWWLELRCACGRMTQVPHRLLARAHGPRARVPLAPAPGERG
mgnify:CR=1 FL=1